MGCASAIVHQLADSKLAHDLFAAAQGDRASLKKFLPRWRLELQDQLQNNRNHLLLRRHPAVASAIPINFPNPKIVRLLAQPLVNKDPVPLWAPKLPNLADLAVLSEEFWGWATSKILLKKFVKKVFPAYISGQLIEVWFIFFALSLY